MQPTKHDLTVNFRQSSYKSLLMCPLRYKYEHVDGLPHKSTGAMFAGTAFHSAIEAAIDARCRNGSPKHWSYSQAGAEDFFRKGWAAAEARYEAEDSLDEIEWHDPKATEATRIYVAFEDWFCRYFPTLPEPVDGGVEHNFKSLEIVPGITIEGTVDYIYEDEDGRLHVKDWKTSKRAWQKSDVARDLQASMYSLAVWELFGDLPVDFTFEVWVKGNSPRHESYTTERTPEDIERFIWQLEQWAQQIREGVFSPNTNGWWCSARWCSYHDVCPAGGGPLPKGLQPPFPASARGLSLAGNERKGA